MGKYRLDLIGPFGLFTPEGRRIEISSKKAVALVALLVCAPSGERSRKWLQTMLWGSREEAQAQTSLRRELSTLAKLLEGCEAGELLVRSTQRVGLALDRLDVDIYALGQGRRGFSGDFLEGLDLRDAEEFEDWLRDERERVRDMIEINIPEPAAPIPGAREILGMDPPASLTSLSKPPPLPPKPSIAVLPFEELTPGGGGWLGMGLADEIGVILSQFPQLFVVATASARNLASQALPKDEIARQLGVRYLLDGTVMQLGDRIRVSVSLIEGQTGEQVWAETFGGPMADLFDLQREIAVQIAPQIWTKVDLTERRRILRLSGPASGSYETYWRANALFRSWERGPVFEAIALAEQLAADDPNCPWATSLAGYCHSIAYMLGYAENRDEAHRRAILHYQTAIRLGEDNVEALGYAAGTLLNLAGDLDMADRLIAHSLALLPAHQPTLFWGGWIDVGLGNAARAQERFELALRINPATGARAQTLTGIGFALLEQDRAAEALPILSEACQASGGFIIAHLGHCIAAVLAGDEAGAARSAALFMGGGRSPDILAVFKRKEDRVRFGGALTKAASLAEIR